MAGIVLRGIGKRYGNAAPTLADIDLEVADGEFMVFVGPSGCGKSTLLRMIAGLEPVTSGTLEIGGRVANAIPAAQRGVAMVFQSYALYPHMTVFENMAFSLEMAKQPRSEIGRAVREAAEILQIGPLLQRRPAELSGGQRQRVAIGRAIVRRPQVFLFDEPLSNLDAALRVQMRIELARLHRELQTTMVYVTHDQVEAMTLGQRIAVFHGGRIEQLGTPLDLYEHPATRFVAGFLGTPAMNFLAARGGADGRALLADGSALDLPAALPAGQDCAIGIRAEYVAPVRGDAEAGNTLAATLRHVEHLGDSAIGYFASPAATGLLAVRLAPGAVPEAGATLRLSLPAARLHAFGADGARLQGGG